MEQFRTTQGTILSLGVTMITFGGTITMGAINPFTLEGMISGMVLLLTGVGLVIWREKRKD